ncbi:MAG TPA: thioredoxin domain-containing protein [Actinotalea sp.]
MSTPPRPSKANRREDARAQALRLKEEQQRAARRQRTFAVAGLVAGVAILAVVVALILGQANSTSLDKTAAPASATASGGILVGKDGIAGKSDGAKAGAVTVALYSDFMCPICKSFEQINGATLDQLRESGDIVMEYHPVSILDRAAMGTQYSTRAANAAATVADQAPDKFLPFMTSLFADQPAENTVGLSDDQIAQHAVDAGVPQAVADTFTKGTFTSWVGAATEQASKDLGQLGTPTILLNGTKLDAKVDWRVAGALEAAIKAAQG